MAQGALKDSSDANASLDLLQVRLRRLEFLLSGASDVDGSPAAAVRPLDGDATVIARLENLRTGLSKVRKSDDVVARILNDVEAICTCGQERIQSATDRI
jgi:hypothetical protein